MRYYTLTELHLPHIAAADGVVVGNEGSHFIVLFKDAEGQTLLSYQFDSSPDERAWHCFKRYYIDTCRRLRKKPWRTPTSIDSLALYICDIVPNVGLAG